MKKCFLILTAILVIHLPFSSLSSAQEEVYKAGDKVEVFRNGKWNRGRVIKIEGDFYEVNFYSYYKNCHEVFPSSRLRTLEAPEGETEVHASQRHDAEQSLPSL
ncbi:MAG: hypothetical protein HQM15_07405 [Deltaproteobacteria bacterium]|nr:hypothetical protein [Deltaproteobacteria bacterium]